MHSHPDATMPPTPATEYAPAPLDGEAALLARYGPQAEALYARSLELVRLCEQEGFHLLAFAHAERAAFWRRVAQDQRNGEQLLLVEAELVEDAA